MAVAGCAGAGVFVGAGALVFVAAAGAAVVVAAAVGAATVAEAGVFEVDDALVLATVALGVNDGEPPLLVPCVAVEAPADFDSEPQPPRSMSATTHEPRIVRVGIHFIWLRLVVSLRAAD